MKKSYELDRVYRGWAGGRMLGSSPFREADETYWVLGVWHSVERTKRHRELVNDEIVGVVFRLDEGSKSFLVFGAE